MAQHEGTARGRTTREAIASDLGVPPEEVRPGTRICDLGIDVYDFEELLESLEARFGVHLPEEEDSTLRTVADLERAVRRARSSRDLHAVRQSARSMAAIGSG